MKLTELLQEQQKQFLTDPKKIMSWIKKYSNYEQLWDEAYTIHRNGVVDVGAYFHIKSPKRSQREIKNVPIKLGKIDGKFDISYNVIDDSSFFPTQVNGEFVCAGNEFRRIDNVPACKMFDANDNKLIEFPIVPAGCCRIDLGGNPIISLIGVADKVGKMEKWNGKDNVIILTCDNVKEGGLGLVLIEGLEDILDDLFGNMTEPFKIIKKYIGRPDDVFECQAELIENGYEQFAQL